MLTGLDHVTVQVNVIIVMLCHVELRGLDIQDIQDRVSHEMR